MVRCLSICLSLRHHLLLATAWVWVGDIDRRLSAPRTGYQSISADARASAVCSVGMPEFSSSAHVELANLHRVDHMAQKRKNFADFFSNIAPKFGSDYYHSQL